MITSAAMGPAENPARSVVHRHPRKVFFISQRIDSLLSNMNLVLFFPPARKDWIRHSVGEHLIIAEIPVSASVFPQK